jgi:hypothetical protein
LCIPQQEKKICSVLDLMQKDLDLMQKDLDLMQKDLDLMQKAPPLQDSEPGAPPCMVAPGHTRYGAGASSLLARCGAAARRSGTDAAAAGWPQTLRWLTVCWLWSIQACPVLPFLGHHRRQFPTCQGGDDGSNGDDCYGGCTCNPEGRVRFCLFELAGIHDCWPRIEIPITIRPRLLAMSGASQFLAGGAAGVSVLIATVRPTTY